jgi:hypothetical protein
MANEHKEDLKKLEKQIDALSNALAKLSNKEDFRELILILRRPGWTTPAEFRFASGIVASMAAQVKGLAALKKDLIEGSKAVVTR